MGLIFSNLIFSAPNPTYSLRNVFKENFSFLCQLYSRFGSDEKLLSQFVFQERYCSTDGRLGNIQLFCSQGDVLIYCHLVENVVIVQVHVYMMLFIHRICLWINRKNNIFKLIGTPLSLNKVEKINSSEEMLLC